MRWPGEVHGFERDDHTRRRLLEGLDGIALTLRDAAAIDDEEQHRTGWLPGTRGR